MGNQACGPSSRRIRSKAVNGAYGPLSGWYDAPRGETSSCGTCSAYCFDEYERGDPGFDPRRWVALQRAMLGLHSGCEAACGTQAWPRDYVHLMRRRSRRTNSDEFYRMSASPVFFAACSSSCSGCCQNSIRRAEEALSQVHCRRGAHRKREVSCCYCPARPRWLDLKGGVSNPAFSLDRPYMIVFDDMARCT